MQILMPHINRVKNNRQNELIRLHKILDNFDNEMYKFILQDIIAQFYIDYQGNLPNNHLMIIDKFKQYVIGNANAESCILKAFNSLMLHQTENPFNINNAKIRSDIINKIITLIHKDTRLFQHLKVYKNDDCMDVAILPSKVNAFYNKTSISICSNIDKQIIQ